MDEEWRVSIALDEVPRAERKSRMRSLLPAHDLTKTSWPNCSATTSEDPVVAAATALARRYLRDQNGMRAIGAAVTALALYVVDGDVITIERVDRLADN